MEKKIIVSGSLNPEKECQDRVRVLSGGGYMSRATRNRLQRPAEGDKKMEQKIKPKIVGIMNVFEMDNRVWSRGGVAPALKATNDKNRTIRKIKKNNTDRSDGRRI